MKQHILNLILVLVIVIGGLYLVQPATAQDCPDCPTCSVPIGEDPCPECFSSDCVQDITGCGRLVEAGTENMVDCGKEGEAIPGQD